MAKTVLITGTSSGFGRLTARKFQAEGWNVAATMRDIAKAGDLGALDRVRVIPLDVTRSASVETAVEEAVAHFGGLDAVVNNAGYGGLALFEQFSDADVRAMFETNYFGALNVARAVLPRFRRQGAGTLINITSLAGIIAGPTASIYASTKWALEAFTEALALEYAPLGVTVRSVAPGAFKTGFTGASRPGTKGLDDSLAAYAGQMNAAVTARVAEMEDQAPSPSLVADAVFACATEEAPIRTMVGPDAEGVAQALASMPRQAFLNRMMSGE